MKKLILILITFALFAFLGCQENPVQPGIVNKSNNELETAISAAPLEERSYEFPEKWIDTIELHDGKGIISINADVIVPDTNKWAVYDAEPDIFTQEEVDKYIEEIYKDGEIYNLSDKTKERYEADLIRYKGMLADCINNPEKYIEGDREEFERKIKIIEKKILEAPEAPDIISTEMKYDEGTKVNILMLQGETEDSSLSNFIAISDDEEYSRTRLEYSRDTANQYEEFYTISEDDSEDITIDIPEETAIEQANRFLEMIGVEDHSFAAIRKAKDRDDAENDIPNREANGAYIIYFTKIYNGVPSLYESNPSFGDEFSKTYYYDRIRFVIDDIGIADVQWLGKEKETGISNENVNLKSFDEIKDIFKQRIKEKLGYIGDNTVKDVRYNITKVQLGYEKFLKKNEIDRFYILPVWEFYIDGIQNNEVILGTPGFESVLSINAIDGSVIEKSHNG